MVERIEEAACLRGFVRMCSEAARLGWHERNGGNLSYRMSELDVRECEPFFDAQHRAWTPLGLCEPTLAGACFMVTGTGCYLCNVELDPSANMGIVQINPAGDAWRVVWGLRDGCPTSEFPTHVMNHAVRMRVTGGTDRVIYHAHVPNLIAMSYLLEPEDAVFTRALWRTMTECVMVFPEGVGVVPWMVPGGVEIARATSEKMERHAAVAWALHGIFCSGASFDAALGLAQVVEKAAQIYRYARQMNGGNPDFPHTITDDGLRAVAKAYGLTLNEALLGE